MHIGIDSVEISRMKKMGESEIKRIFSKNEQEYCNKKQNPKKHYAGTFAAKEASLKALHKEVKAKTTIREIEVFRNKQGVPSAKKEGINLEISITYSGDTATAIALIKNGNKK